MNDSSLQPGSDPPVWKRHLRKLVALAILLGGLGWVASRHWTRPARHTVSLEVRVSPEIYQAGGELVVFIDDARAETIWTFRGRMTEPVRRFEPELVPGRYEVLAQWHPASGNVFTVKVQFDASGPRVIIRIPGS